MEDFIIGKIEEIFGTVVSAGGSDLNLTPQTFNSGIYDGICQIMQNAVMPVAYIIFALFCLIELNNIVVRNDGMNDSTGVQIPFKLMFKVVICKWALDNTMNIMNAIYAVTNEIMGNINGVITGGGSLTSADIETIRGIVEDMDFGVKLLTSVEVLLIFFVVKLVNVFITVIVVGRMIEIYVYMAMAPLPMTTFCGGDLSSVGKNFLKNFMAVCIQGVLIFIVLAIFPLMLQGAVVGSISDPNNFADSLFNAAGYSFVLLIAIFFTGRWSKSICNAM